MPHYDRSRSFKVIACDRQTDRQTDTPLIAKKCYAMPHVKNSNVRVSLINLCVFFCNQSMVIKNLQSIPRICWQQCFV